MANKSLTLISLLLFSNLTACSSSPKKNDMASDPTIESDTPQEVRCQGEPANCEYEIQEICKPPDTYELIGKPIPSFFSSSVTYRVRYKCIKAK